MFFFKGAHISVLKIPNPYVRSRENHWLRMKFQKCEFRVDNPLGLICWLGIWDILMFPKLFPKAEGGLLFFTV